MIVYDEKKLIFLHVPKAAGTSIRSLFPDNDRYWGIETKPDGHIIDLAHMTLEELRQYYPAEFAKLATYRSFAAIREPHERFISALFEYMRNFRGKEKSRVGLSNLWRHARIVMDALPSDDVEFSHFKKQIDFVRIGSEIIASDVYPLGMIDRMLGEMSRYTGCQFRIESKNVNERSSRLDKIGKFGFREFFVGDTFVGPLAAKIREFIEEHYRDDLDLYARLQHGPMTRKGEAQFPAPGYA